MKILIKPLAILGFAIIFLSSILCPFMRVPLVGNWNLYQLDTSLFFVTMGVLSLCVFFFFLRSVRLYKISTYIFAVWSVLGFLAVYFKMNNFFGFRFMDNLLAKTLHLKWGWFFLFLGAVILLLSVRTTKEIRQTEDVTS